VARCEACLVAVLALVPVVALAQEKPAEKAAAKADPKPDAAPVASPAPAALKLGEAGLPAPPAALAKILEAFDKEKEPARELERCYASSLYYLLDRDLERFLACYHPRFALHDGTGRVVTVPPADLKALVRQGWEATPRSALTLPDMVDLTRIRVYTRAEAKLAENDGWKKEPTAIAAVMEDADMLVIAPTQKKVQGEKADAFESEVFFIFRKQDGHYRIVLGE
jgi:hypothetical protein